MGLNKVKQGSQMYQWLNDNGNRGYTWNVIKGKCPHDCSYCYMKRYPQAELHFDNRELKTDLGSGNTIFVGSSCDMWAASVERDWILQVLNHCSKHRNRYLFQSKNPMRFLQHDFTAPFSGRPIDVLLGTTIESNRWVDGVMGKDTISPKLRAIAMADVCKPKMVSIEPIINFDLELMVDWIARIKPEFVSIGADSGNNHLPEPSWAKVQSLIKELEQLTEVKLKDNLKRLNRGMNERYSI